MGPAVRPALLAVGVLLLARALRPRRLAFTALLVAACLPLGLMALYGRADHRRRADLVVVFGARAYADGRPSRALADRVRTAAQLFGEGLVRRVVLSGGPGDGAVHETEAMRRLLLSLGVPPSAIVLDRSGLSTRDTARNVREMCERLGAESVLAVSHAYHLPRVKMTLEREHVRVFTVPARETKTLAKLPWLVAREVAAFWAYWIRPGPP